MTCSCRFSWRWTGPRTIRAPADAVGRAGQDRFRVAGQVEAEQPLLTGITYDDGDDIVVIGLDAPGGLPEDLEHIVYHPQKIYLAEEDDVMIFDIEDSEEVKTLVRLEPAA